MSLIVSYAYLIPILQESKVNALCKVAQVRGTRGRKVGDTVGTVIGHMIRCWSFCYDGSCRGAP